MTVAVSDYHGDSIPFEELEEGSWPIEDIGYFDKDQMELYFYTEATSIAYQTYYVYICAKALAVTNGFDIVQYVTDPYPLMFIPYVP